MRRVLMSVTAIVFILTTGLLVAAHAQGGSGDGSQITIPWKEFKNLVPDLAMTYGTSYAGFKRCGERCRKLMYPQTIHHRTSGSHTICWSPGQESPSRSRGRSKCHSTSTRQVPPVRQCWPCRVDIEATEHGCCEHGSRVPLNSTFSFNDSRRDVYRFPL